MDWLNSLLNQAGQTYATVKNAQNAPILAQQAANGQQYIQGQPIPQGLAISTPLLIVGAVGLFLLLKD